MFAKLISTLLLATLAPLATAAQVIVFNGDPPGVGFNDPTPAAPVGGNPGTTRGEQALNVFQRAADIWGSKLQSRQPITVIAFFLPLNCTPTGGVLGAAGANWYFRDVAGGPGGKDLDPGTWYPAALADKITNTDIIGDPADPFEIFAFFNSELGKPGCLQDGGWYFGLDNNEPANLIDLMAVVLHEFGHGLGFSVGPTSSSSGARAQGFPSVWERFMYDATAQKTWLQMASNAERFASARNDLNLVWIGPKASNVVPSVLDRRIDLQVLRPQGIASGEAQGATFGPALVQAPGQSFGGNLIAATDTGGASTLDGCEPLSNPAAVAGRIVLVNRGNCTFTAKAKNAQNAGAAAVLIANNVATGLPGMGGVDPTITIPAWGISQAQGAALRAAGSGVYIELQRNPNVRAGTLQNYPRLYAPSTFAQGSSVSHWDVSATPNLLMEPFINADLTKSVKNPEDLTRGLFKDIGW
jgi:hypothetical protein